MLEVQERAVVRTGHMGRHCLLIVSTDSISHYFNVILSALSSKGIPDVLVLTSLEAFHMRCQQQILARCWTDLISNVTVSSHTGLASVGEEIASRRVAIFGHIARLGEEVSAHQGLRVYIDISLGCLPGRDWKRHPIGR